MRFQGRALAVGRLAGPKISVRVFLHGSLLAGAADAAAFVPSESCSVGSQRQRASVVTRDVDGARVEERARRRRR